MDWYQNVNFFLVFLQTRLDVYTTHSPAGTSVQNMIHYAQVSLRKHLKILSHENRVG